KAAEYIQQQTGADLLQLQAKDPYSTNYMEIIARSQQEMQSGSLPEIEVPMADFSQYDTIFVGYPIWYGTYALPMKSWLSTTDLKGKVVVPFCTFGSGGYAKSVADLKAQQPEAKVLEGFGIRSKLMELLPAVADDMLTRVEMKAGEAEQKGDFSEPKTVEQADADLFNEAVKGYEMLNATPLTVASRDVKVGKEYCFDADNKRPDGSTMKVKVYVTKENDKAPYFTLVDYLEDEQ
ncbi:MAG: hypothetical protein K6G08_09655, partial [Prevotella sp.]|nr:hypothetical protein [Prevotella sp.]